MTRVRLTIEVDVTNPELLARYAQARYRECWYEELPADDLPKAALEALVLSNENPSPDTYGIEIVEYSAEIVKGTEDDAEPTD